MFTRLKYIINTIRPHGAAKKHSKGGEKATVFGTKYVAT